MRPNLCPPERAVGKSRQEGDGVRNISLPPQENLEGRVLRRDEGTSFGVVADALGAGEPRLGGRGHCKSPLQAPKEVDHRGTDLWRTFLLGPMTTAREHYRRPELGDQYRLCRDVLGENGGDKIPVTRHV